MCFWRQVFISSLWQSHQNVLRSCKYLCFFVHSPFTDSLLSKCWAQPPLFFSFLLKCLECCPFPSSCTITQHRELVEHLRTRVHFLLICLCFWHDLGPWLGCLQLVFELHVLILQSSVLMTHSPCLSIEPKFCSWKYGPLKYFLYNFFPVVSCLLVF